MCGPIRYFSVRVASGNAHSTEKPSLVAGVDAGGKTGSFGRNVEASCPFDLVSESRSSLSAGRAHI
jgi:hypothetical protein